jgi:hypothetical protein
VLRALPGFGSGWQPAARVVASAAAASGLLNSGSRMTSSHAATENPFGSLVTDLPKPGEGTYGKYYSLPKLNDPRVGKFSCYILTVAKQSNLLLINDHLLSFMRIGFQLYPGRICLHF